MDEDVGTPHASTPANRCSHPSTSFPSPSTSSAHGSAISAELRRPRGTVPGADVLFARCARTSWKAAATASRKPAPAPWQPSPGTCSSSSALLAGRCQWRYQIRRDLRDFLDDHRLVREERGHLLQPGHRATVGLVGTPDRRIAEGFHVRCCRIVTGRPVACRAPSMVTGKGGNWPLTSPDG